MGLVIRLANIGNSLALIVPKPFCRQKNLKRGDLFEVYDDVVLPDTFTFKKIGNNKSKL